MEPVQTVWLPRSSSAGISACSFRARIAFLRSFFTLLVYHVYVWTRTRSRHYSHSQLNWERDVMLAIQRSYPYLLQAPASGLHSTHNYDTHVSRVQHFGLASTSVRAFTKYIISQSILTKISITMLSRKLATVQTPYFHAVASAFA